MESRKENRDKVRIWNLDREKSMFNHAFFAGDEYIGCLVTTIDEASKICDLLGFKYGTGCPE